MTEEGKPSPFSAIHMDVAVRIQLETQGILQRAVFPWHPFPAGVTRGLMPAGESPGQWQPLGCHNNHRAVATLAHAARRLGL